MPRPRPIPNPSQYLIARTAFANYPGDFSPWYTPFRTELGFNESLSFTPSDWGDEDPLYSVEYDRRFNIEDQCNLEHGMQDWVFDEHLDMLMLEEPRDYTDSGYALEPDLEAPRWPFPTGFYATF